MIWKYGFFSFFQLSSSRFFSSTFSSQLWAIPTIRWRTLRSSQLWKRLSSWCPRMVSQFRGTPITNNRILGSSTLFKSSLKAKKNLKLGKANWHSLKDISTLPQIPTISRSLTGSRKSMTRWESSKISLLIKTQGMIGYKRFWSKSWTRFRISRIQRKTSWMQSKAISLRLQISYKRRSRPHPTSSYRPSRRQCRKCLKRMHKCKYSIRMSMRSISDYKRSPYR